MASREEKQVVDVDGDGSEEEIAPRVMPNRTTRGKRMTALVENELWKQDEVKALFAEVEDDEEYEKSDAEDIVDSDFDAPEEEDEPADEDEDYEEKPKRGRKRKPPARSAPKRTSRKTSRAAARDEEDEDYDEEEERPKKRARLTKAEKLAALAPRKSARPQTMERTMAREMREAVTKEKPRRKRAKVQRRVLTQEEQLKRAEKTERENKLSLEWLMYVEEEKKKVPLRKAALPGPRVVLRSIRVQDPRYPGQFYERSFVTWTGVNDLPGFLHQPMQHPKPKPQCVMHREQSCGIDEKGNQRTPRYREPKSGYVYCCVEALAHLREYVKKQKEEAAARKAAEEAAALAPQGTTIAYDSEGRPYTLDLAALRSAPMLVMREDGSMVPVANSAEAYAALGMTALVAPTPIVPQGVPLWLAQYIGAQVMGSDGQVYDAVALALAQAAAAANTETYLIAADPDNQEALTEFYAVIGSDGGEMLVPADVARQTPVFVDPIAAAAAASGDPAAAAAPPPPPAPAPSAPAPAPSSVPAPAPSAPAPAPSASAPQAHAVDAVSAQQLQQQQLYQQQQQLLYQQHLQYQQQQAQQAHPYHYFSQQTAQQAAGYNASAPATPQHQAAQPPPTSGRGGLRKRT